MTVAEQVEAFERAIPGIFDGMQAPVLIGAGGRAHVFRVERPSPIKADQPETVALKVFGLHALAPNEVERFFQAEKDALARLRALMDGCDDERVLRLVRFHETLAGTFRERPVFAFVGEYFSHGTLTRWRADRDRVSTAQLVGLVRDICDGLQFLHDRGEVHQDLKPDNVFIVEPEAEAPVDFAQLVPRARLGDFGCTRPDGVLTESRTPLFAPDIGEPLDSGGRYDIFSLGCLVAFLIKGRLVPADRRFGRLSPFVLEAPRQNGMVIGADDRWYRDVTALLGETTRPDPTRRPGARAFAERFARICAATEVRARRRQKRARRWSQFAPIVPTVVVALVIGGASWFAWHRHREMWTMPAERIEFAPGVSAAWRGNRLMVARTDKPDRVHYAVPLPSAPTGWYAVKDSGQVAHIALWGADWTAWWQPANGQVRLLMMYGNGTVVERTGNGEAVEAIPVPGNSDETPVTIRPHPRGVVRCSERMLDLYEPPPAGETAWRLVFSRPLPDGQTLIDANWNPDVDSFEYRLPSGDRVPISIDILE